MLHIYFLVSSKVKCLLWAKNYIKIYDFISVYIHAYVCVCPRWLYLNWMSYFSVEISNIYNWITTIASDVQLNSMNSIPHTQLESRAQNPDIVGIVDFVCTFWLVGIPTCWTVEVNQRNFIKIQMQGSYYGKAHYSQPVLG